MWYLYILESESKKVSDGFGIFYTGISTDIKKRLRQHNGELAKGSKYTSLYRPWKIVYSEVHESRSDASKREYQIKQMTRNQKLKIVGLV